MDFTKKRLQQEFEDKLEVEQQSKRQLERRVRLVRGRGRHWAPRAGGEWPVSQAGPWENREGLALHEGQPRADYHRSLRFPTSLTSSLDPRLPSPSPTTLLTSPNCLPGLLRLLTLHPHLVPASSGPCRQIVMESQRTLQQLKKKCQR